MSTDIAFVLSKHQNIGMKAVSFGQNPISELSNEIVKTLFNHRRQINNQEAPQALEVFTSIWSKKVAPYVEAQKPIEIMIAAFPFKSLSRNKCISEHADMAEVSCIRYLNDIMQEIKAIYPPGGKLNIFSDGHIFSGIEGNPTNESANLYAQELKEIIRQNNPDGSITLITLKDMFGDNTKGARQKILEEHGKTLEKIRERVLTDSVIANDYCGIKRFVYEELGGIEPYSQMSNAKRQKLSKLFAYQTVQVAEAWTSFLRTRLPEAIRFSCHPQDYSTPDKIGIWLGKSKDNWLTPWMGVAVKTQDGNFCLMQNSQAKELGLKLIYNKKGLPSHYEFPKDPPSKTFIG